MDGKALMKVMLEAIDTERWGQLGQLFAEAATYRAPGFETMVGRSAIIRYYEVTRQIASGLHTIDHLIQEGNQVASFGRFSGTTRMGNPVEAGFADHCLLESGLIQSRVVYLFPSSSKSPLKD